MSNILIATIFVLAIVLAVLGYLWLVPRRKNANFRAYEEISRAAERKSRAKYKSRGVPIWR